MKTNVFQIKQAIPCTCGESEFEWEFESGKNTKFNPMLPYTFSRKKVAYKCPECGAIKKVHVDELAGSCNFPRISMCSNGNMSWKCTEHGSYTWPLDSEPDDLVEALQNIFDDPYGLDVDCVQPCCVQEHIEEEQRRQQSVGNSCIRCGMPDDTEDLIEIPVQMENSSQHKAFLCCTCYEGEDIGLIDMFVSNIENIDGETVYTLSSGDKNCDDSIKFSCSDDWMDRCSDF